MGKCTCDGVCAFVCVLDKGRLPGQVQGKGTAAFRPPRAAQLGCQVIFSRLLDGISIHTWLFNFHSEGVLSPHDSHTAPRPIKYSNSILFSNFCPFSKRSSFCLLVCVLFPINKQQGRTPHMVRVIWDSGLKDTIAQGLEYLSDQASFWAKRS